MVTVAHDVSTAWLAYQRYQTEIIFAATFIQLHVENPYVDNLRIVEVCADVSADVAIDDSAAVAAVVTEVVVSVDCWSVVATELDEVTSEVGAVVIALSVVVAAAVVIVSVDWYEVGCDVSAATKKIHVILKNLQLRSRTVVWQ